METLPSRLSMLKIDFEQDLKKVKENDEKFE